MYALLCVVAFVGAFVASMTVMLSDLVKEKAEILRALRGSGRRIL